MTLKSDGNSEMDTVRDALLLYASETELKEIILRCTADMSKAVNRYLAEQAWRDNGDLGVLVSYMSQQVVAQVLTDSIRPSKMQRVSQMSIVPDILGRLEPKADLRVVLKDTSMEPGSFLEPSQVRPTGRISLAKSFHY